MSPVDRARALLAELPTGPQAGAVIGRADWIALRMVTTDLLAESDADASLLDSTARVVADREREIEELRGRLVRGDALAATVARALAGPVANRDEVLTAGLTAYRSTK